MTHLPASPDTLDSLIDDSVIALTAYTQGSYEITSYDEVVIDRLKLKAKLESLLVEARIEEAKHMPHQYDPDLLLHTMSKDVIPMPTECRCYKGKRLADLEAEHLKLREQH